MKKILLPLFLIVLSFSSTKVWAQDAGPIVTFPSPFDCINGKNSLPLEISVGEELFEFEAKCNWHLEEFFRTQNGDDCQVYSSMCTQERHYVQLWVHCRRGGKALRPVACPRFP